jgi:CRP-like cAMP-binding protein
MLRAAGMPARSERAGAVAESGPGGLRSATVIAAEAVLALVISTDDFAAIISEHPSMHDIVKMQAYDRRTG